MSYVWHYVVVLLCSVAALCGVETSRRWSAAPRVALVLWQILSLAIVLSLLGGLLSAGLAPYQRGIIPAVGDFLAGRGPALPWWQAGAVLSGLFLVCWVAVAFVVCLARLTRIRRRHRALLSLVGRHEAAFDDATVLDHPGVAAFCLPGRRPEVVISRGTAELLGPAELNAVLAHERTHARERHHLVLLPYAALLLAFPRSRWVRRAFDRVALLVEMCADDRATRAHDPRQLVAALVRFQTGSVGAAPPGTLAAADRDVAIRIQRLLAPARRPSVLIRGVVVTAAVILAATPASLFVLPI